MYDGHSVGVVIPAYNEEGRIGHVIDRIPPCVDRIYVIDDGSTDGTWTEVRETLLESREQRQSGNGPARSTTTIYQFSDTVNKSSQYAQLLSERVSIVEDSRRMVALRHEQNRGAGGAIKTGYLAGLTDGVDIVVTIDGDGQMDPVHIPRFLDPIVRGEVEYTKGTRFVGRNSVHEMPSFRLFGNLILTALTNISSGYWGMTDPQNGYTAITTRALHLIEVEELFEYYGYCNNVLTRLNVHNIPIADVPMDARYGDEHSNIEYPTYIWLVSGLLARDLIWRLQQKYF